MVLPLVSITDSITNLPDESKTAIKIVSLCTSIPIYLVLSIKGCSFPERLRRTLKTYSKGAPFYIASAYRRYTGLVLGQPVGKNPIQREILTPNDRRPNLHKFEWGRTICFRTARTRQIPPSCFNALQTPSTEGFCPLPSCEIIRRIVV